MITGYSDNNSRRFWSVIEQESVDDRCIDAFRYKEEKLARATKGGLQNERLDLEGRGGRISRPLNASSNICYRGDT